MCGSHPVAPRCCASAEGPLSWWLGFLRSIAGSLAVLRTFLKKWPLIVTWDFRHFILFIIFIFILIIIITIFITISTTTIIIFTIIIGIFGILWDVVAGRTL
jgi:hypothetical protein